MYLLAEQPAIMDTPSVATEQELLNRYTQELGQLSLPLRTQLANWLAENVVRELYGGRDGKPLNVLPFPDQGWIDEGLSPDELLAFMRADRPAS